MKHFIALVALMLGACGLEPTATAVTNGDPCSLVAPADMAVMFGALRDGPLPSTGLRNERQCNYTNLDGSWVKLSVARVEDRWDENRRMANEPRAIGGLGDEAFATRRGTDAVVFVRKGDAILELSCSCSAATAEAIARVATMKL